MSNLLFFDIDGTLITNDGRKYFPEDAKKALAEAREAGNLIFINTGRPFVNVDDFIRKVGFDGYVCGIGSYVRLGDRVLFHQEMDQGTCREIALKCREYKMRGLYEYADYTCYDEENFDIPDTQKLLAYFGSKDRKLVSRIENPEFRFDKFTAWYSEDSNLDAFRDYIREYFNYIEREGDFCELGPKGCSKATGIQKLLDYFGESPENVYVFGDGNNDLDMLNFTANSICMEKGSEEARSAANFITSDVEEGGIRKALEHFHLL